MLAVMEGQPGDIVRFDAVPPGIEASHESTIDGIFSPIPMGYVIAAFNDIPTLKNPDKGEGLSIIGLELEPPFDRIQGHEQSAWFVSRTPDRKYTLHEVKELPLRPQDQPLDPDLGLRAVRTLVVSPFPDDNGSVLFMGGFDPVFECPTDPRAVFNLHDNAWVYRVGIRSALVADDPTGSVPATSVQK
jgi:hypothetical protein